MAGPTASVLFSGTLPSGIGLRELMDDVADSRPDDSLFHIGDTTKFGGEYAGEFRPFVGRVYDVRSAEHCSVCPAEIDAINTALATKMTHCVELGAMCNSQADHRLLCEIAGYLSKTHDGFVDFHDVITDVSRDDLYNASWTEDGDEYVTQLGRPTACQWWLQQSNFRMVK